MIDHSPPEGVKPTKEAAEGFMRMFITAFPDVKADVEMQTADGNTVWTRKWFTGTHQRAFAGIEPTNKQVIVMRIHSATF